MNARRHGGMVVAGALIATLVLSSPALTAGPGSGGGGAGGGGGGAGGGGGGAGETTGSLYSDLVIALRAENGTPILKKYEVPATEETEAATEYCVQPVSYEQVPGLTSSVNPVDGRDVYVLPLQGEWIASPPPGPLPVAEIEACDPWPQYAMFVSEVELERLNLIRTSDEVIADKLGDVEMKLRFAEAIALQSTGRITFDGTTIDASPENAAIYRSLMTTGTIPGLPAAMAGPPARIGPAPADDESNSRFDAWELAAAAIGGAASKGTPINVDTIEYYNRISGLSAAATVWGDVHFVQSSGSLSDGERFVDYSGFTYNRSQTYKGSVTWLDVSTLTWKVDKITSVVPFTNLSSFAEIGNRTLSGVVAFAQLADDVRAMSNFIPDNTFIPGFTVDLPGFDTTADQRRAITEPAVDLGTLPGDVFKTFAFDVTASLRNPFGGTLIEGARLRLTIDAPDALAKGDVTVTAADGQAVPFTVEGGDLVGWWGPASGFPAAPGYNVSTTFEATIGGKAPIGAYSLKLDLLKVTGTGTVLARDTGTITVNDNVATVLWGDPLPKSATQGTWATIPLRVYAPAVGTGQLTLTITAPDALATGDVTVYGVTSTDMVAMPLTLTGGSLGGTWDVALGAGYTPVTWYANVAAGAPVGDYAFGVSLEGGNTLQPAVVVVFAPDEHGEQPPDAGEDTTAPVVTIESVGTPGSTATFTLTADEEGVKFECRLDKDGSEVDAWAACTSPRTYAGLEPGAYLFSARGTDRVGLVSTVVTYGWTAADTIAPVVTIAPDGTPGATATFTLTADEDGVTFKCQLTKDSVAGDWAPCTSPTQYLGLTTGTYIFSATATDAAGNTSVPTTYSWTIAPPNDITAPVVTITPTLPLGATATFTLTADEAGVTFECQLTRNAEVLAAWARCTSPKTYTNLKVGTYVFSVRGTDAAGNHSLPKTYTWTVKKGGRS